MKQIRIILLMVFSLSVASLSAQTDSLSLSRMLEAVFSQYPELKKASNDLTAADAKIALSKSSRLPDVSFSAGYNRVGPVTAFNLGGHSVHLMPENMYNAAFTLTENLYDFGKSEKNTVIEETSKSLQQITVDQLRQRLTQAVLGTYYTICYLQEAIRIKDEQLNTLNQHVLFVQKKEATGSATQYDLLSTRVRISSVENQKTDLQTALEVQWSTLNGLMGTSNNTIALKNETLTVQSVSSLESLCQQAFAQRQEMKLAVQKSELLKLRLEAIGVQNNPSLNLQAMGGFKNGYFNSGMEDVGKLNFNVGIGLRVPVFDANRAKYAKVQAAASLDNSNEDIELLRRSITNDVVESRANVLAALKKINQCALQLQQAIQAYNLAETSYKNGAITNLDVLDSYTAVSESKLGLFKARTDYQYSLKKLSLATGSEILSRNR